MRRILRKIAEGEMSNLGDTTTLLDPGVVEIFTAIEDPGGVAQRCIEGESGTTLKGSHIRAGISDRIPHQPLPGT